MSATIESLITADDLLNMPEDGLRHVLLKGELRTLAPEGFHHGILAGQIFLNLAEFVRRNDLDVVLAAETGFKIASNPDTVRAPDVAFVCKERFEKVGPTEKFWPGAPDLAVEVVSPNDTYTEVQDKVYDWLAAGTRMVLVADPRKRRACAGLRAEASRAVHGPFALCAGAVIAYGAPAIPARRSRTQQGDPRHARR